MPKAVGIVVAGGSSSRLGGDQNKVYLPVGGRPLLSWSLAAFNRAASIDAIVLVVRKTDHEQAADAVRLALADKTVAVVTGGGSRQDSEWAGLDVVRGLVLSGEVDVVALHDGARPLVTPSLIDAVVEQARLVGGAVPGLRVEEPLFEHTSAGLRRIAGGLVRVQTPQAFRAGPLLAAHDAARRSGDTTSADTAETIERFGSVEVAFVPGHPENLKVTYPEDVEVARAIARRRSWSWHDLPSNGEMSGSG